MSDPDVYLFKRTENGFWYFRRPIPKRLQPFLNLGNKRTAIIAISLKSAKLDPKARARHHELLLESERLFEEAEERAKAAENGGAEICNGTGPADTLKRRMLIEFSDSELVSLVQRWFLKEQANALEKSRSIYNFSTKEVRRDHIAALQSRLSALTDENRDGPALETLTTKRIILEEAGGAIELVKRGRAIGIDRDLTEWVGEALALTIRYSLAIVETGMPPVLQSLSPHLSPAALEEASRRKNSITLNELVERFDKDARERELKPRTLDEFAIVYRMLREFLGSDTPIDSITRDQMRELQGLYASLPAHSPRLYRGKSLREAAELAKKEKREPMERATFNKRITLLAAIFNFAVTEQLLEATPAKGLTLEKKKHQEGYKVFSNEQLQCIFNGSIYQDFMEEPEARLTPNHPLEPHLFWTPLIALFQGMRMGEILQLRAEDIAIEDAVNCIRIRDIAEGQSLKTKTSFRTVPIHPVLKQLGFLDYVANLRNSGGGDLFPEATRGKTYDNRSHNYSKKFNRYLRLIGVKQGREQCFHSFRHTFADGVRIAEVPQEAIRRLGGWTDKSSSETGYGGRLLPFLALHLPKLQFKGLDLSHLTGNAKPTRRRAALPPPSPPESIYAPPPEESERTLQMNSGFLA